MVSNCLRGKYWGSPFPFGPSLLVGHMGEDRQAARTQRITRVALSSKINGPLRVLRTAILMASACANLSRLSRSAPLSHRECAASWNINCQMLHFNTFCCWKILGPVRREAGILTPWVNNISVTKLVRPINNRKTFVGNFLIPLALLIHHSMFGLILAGLSGVM
jgi:hypothetical protein